MYAVQIRTWERQVYITDLTKITDVVTSATNLKLVEIDGYVIEVINPNINQNDPANHRQVAVKPIVNQWMILSIQELV
jgi:hypothetical protein